MINKQLLESLYQENLKDDCFGDEPKRMFENGVFNPNNWNGGDDLIRNFFEDLYEERIDNTYIIEEDDGWTSKSVICHVDYLDDQNHAIINVNGDLYYFEWYKNRGCTEIAKLNSKDMTEDEYIELLNILEKTGYRFTK